MPQKMKVRHALINYTVKLPGDRQSNETAFRGAIVEIEDQNEFDRLMSLGALIPVDQELERPGRLMDLPETASDEEILNWVANASNAEIQKAAAERPELQSRMMGALQRIEDQRAAAAELLGHKSRVEGAIDRLGPRPEYDHLGRPTRADDGTTAGVQMGVGGTANVPHDAEPLDEEGDEGENGEESGSEGEDPNAYDFDAIVRRNVNEVTEFIATHPTLASHVLDAENRHASATGKDGPRSTVVRAVEAAAGHTQ